MTGFAERFNTLKCLKSSLLTLKMLPKPGDCPSLLLNHPDSKTLAILAIQEHRNPKTQAPLTHQSWTLIEPPSQENTRPRAAIYINNRILSPESYQPIHYPSTDVAMMEIKVESKHPMQHA